MEPNIKLTIHKALFMYMVYTYPVWEFADDTHILKLQRLQNTFLHKKGKSPRHTTAWKLHVTLKTIKLNIQGIHKRMVQFQKLTRHLFLTLHGHNVHRQQPQLSEFLMHNRGARFQDGPRGPAVSMRSELLVTHEKLGQLPLLTVYVVPV